MNEREPISYPVTVTPEMAKAWLEAKASNRSISDRKVEQLASEMEAGRWKLNHQGIAFNSHGMLIDGQHRLAAVVRSGVSARMMRTDNLSDDAVPTIDIHRPRSWTDVIRQIEGNSHITAKMVSLARSMMNPSSGNCYGLTIAETAQFIHEHWDAINFTLQSIRSHLGGIAVAPVLAAIARAYYHCDHDRLEEFGKVLVTGVPQDARADVGAVRLRAHLLGSRGIGHSRDRTDVFLRTEAAIRVFCERKYVGCLMASKSDIYPLPDRLTDKSAGQKAA